jgi:hypothetical protein
MKSSLSGSNGAPSTDDPRMGRNVAGLLHDVVELSELQGKLLVHDVRSMSGNVRTALVLALVGAALLLGSLPVALTALAELLVQQAAWSRPAAYGAATAIGAVASVLLLGGAWWRIRRGLAELDRSREELASNVAWLKSMLKGAGQNVQKR